MASVVLILSIIVLICWLDKEFGSKKRVYVPDIYQLLAVGCTEANYIKYLGEKKRGHICILMPLLKQLDMLKKSTMWGTTARLSIGRLYYFMKKKPNKIKFFMPMNVLGQELDFLKCYDLDFCDCLFFASVKWLKGQLGNGWEVIIKTTNPYNCYVAEQLGIICEYQKAPFQHLGKLQLNKVDQKVKEQNKAIMASM